MTSRVRKRKLEMVSKQLYLGGLGGLVCICFNRYNTGVGLPLAAQVTGPGTQKNEAILQNKQCLVKGVIETTSAVMYSKIKS